MSRPPPHMSTPPPHLMQPKIPSLPYFELPAGMKRNSDFNLNQKSCYRAHGATREDGGLWLQAH